MRLHAVTVALFAVLVAAGGCTRTPQALCITDAECESKYGPDDENPNQYGSPYAQALGSKQRAMPAGD